MYHIFLLQSSLKLIQNALDVPNAGNKLVTLPKRLEWNKVFKKYVQELDKKKPVIICGDMNVAHQEIGITFVTIIVLNLVAFLSKQKFIHSGSINYYFIAN